MRVVLKQISSEDTKHIQTHGIDEAGRRMALK